MTAPSSTASQGAWVACALFVLLCLLNIYVTLNAYLVIGIAAIGGAIWQARPCWRSTCTAIDIKAKSLGMAVFVMLLAVTSTGLHWLIPHPALQFFIADSLFLIPLALILCWPMAYAIERRTPQPEDDYQRLGADVLQGHLRWRQHQPLLLAWAVRCFFIPLIYAWTLWATADLLRYQWQLQPLSLVLGLFQLGLCLDLLMALCGYVFSSRLFGNKVISTDSTWSGWLVCLICYPPLLAILHAMKQQTDDVIWSDWLSSHDGGWYWLWCLLISGTWGVYFWASINMGFKFSNLSWRGLVSHGAYRYCKHPAYVAKNIYWWAHTVPFVGVASGWDLARNLCGLSFVSLIYWLRAKTEERHLMQFAEYRAYAAHMEQHSLWARLKRIVRIHA